MDPSPHSLRIVVLRLAAIDCHTGVKAESCRPIALHIFCMRLCLRPLISRDRGLAVLSHIFLP
jgi:hypothetical protein